MSILPRLYIYIYICISIACMNKDFDNIIRYANTFHFKLQRKIFYRERLLFKYALDWECWNELHFPFEFSLKERNLLEELLRVFGLKCSAFLLAMKSIAVHRVTRQLDSVLVNDKKTESLQYVGLFQTNIWRCHASHNDLRDKNIL